MRPTSIQVKEVIVSDAGSEKYLFSTGDGGLFEGVRIQTPTVINLCLSSQIGCSYECRHCATGLLNFKRNLSPEEMLKQAQEMAKCSSYDVLFLGMGEPYLNLPNILESISLMISDKGLSGYKQALIGSSGIPNLAKGLSMIAALDERPHLSFSIHGVPDDIRVRIIPHTTIYGLEKLERDVVAYQERTGDAVTFNYNPLDGINDSDDNYLAFAKWSKKFNCIVRVIPWNQVPGVGFRPSRQDRIERFFNILDDQGIYYIYRPNYGTDIYAGCGQLGRLGY